MNIVVNNKLDLIYKLEGEIDEGISVFELSPILLNLGQLIQESNRILTTERREIAVNVKPFEKGSFIVDISVFAHTNLQQALDLMTQENVKNVKELLEWIGLIGASGVSLIKLVKFLKGKPKSVEKLSPGEVRYVAKEGQQITVSNKVHALFQSVNIQNSIYQIAGRPFDIPNVAGVSSYLKEKEDNKVEISSEESDYFKEFKNPEIFDDSEMTKTSKMTLLLNPKRGSYEGGKGPYSFTVSGDQNLKYTMDIRDEEFLQKLEKGEIRLHYSDLIEASILIEQKVKDNVVVSTTYHIEKVLSYSKAKEYKNIELFED